MFFELKAVYKNIRAGFDGNLRDYLGEHVIAHAFHHNAFILVSNGHCARYGSITSQWEHFSEWKRLDEGDKGSVEAEVLLNGILARDRLLDLVENFILFDASKPGATRKVIALNHQLLGWTTPRRRSNSGCLSIGAGPPISSSPILCLCPSARR